MLLISCTLEKRTFAAELLKKIVYKWGKENAYYFLNMILRKTLSVGQFFVNFWIARYTKNPKLSPTDWNITTDENCRLDRTWLRHYPPNVAKILLNFLLKFLLVLMVLTFSVPVKNFFGNSACTVPTETQTLRLVHAAFFLRGKVVNPSPLSCKNYSVTAFLFQLWLSTVSASGLSRYNND